MVGLAQYPFQGARLNLGGLNLHYLDEGQGEPLVMLHGNPTWSFMFRNLVLGLRNEFRAIVPDHMGCGFSDQPESGQYEFTLARRVADLEALIDHLNLTQPITLVVHDWGGMIGMTYAAKHPERIRRLVVFNTGGFHLPATTRLPLSLLLCRRTPLADFLIRQTGLFVKLTLRWGACHGLSAPVRAGYMAPCGRAQNRLAHLRFVQDIPLVTSDPSYALVSATQAGLAKFQKTPALILWGERDWVFNKHFLAEWRRQLPAAQVHTFPQAGHLVLEDARDEILPLVRQFLKT